MIFEGFERSWLYSLWNEYTVLEIKKHSETQTSIIQNALICYNEKFYLSIFETSLVSYELPSPGFDNRFALTDIGEDVSPPLYNILFAVAYL